MGREYKVSGHYHCLSRPQVGVLIDTTKADFSRRLTQIQMQKNASGPAGEQTASRSQRSGSVSDTAPAFLLLSCVLKCVRSVRAKKLVCASTYPGRTTQWIRWNEMCGRRAS